MTGSPNGRIDPGIRLGGFEQHDGRLPEYRLHGRRHAPSDRSHELLRRGFRLRGRRHGPASWLMGLFRFLREFGRRSGHADARERHDHARFRLRRRLRAGRFQNYLGSDLDHHTRVTQRRRTGAQQPGGVRGLDQRPRHVLSRIERHDRGRRTSGFIALARRTPSSGPSPDSIRGLSRLSTPWRRKDAFVIGVAHCKGVQT